MPYDIIVSDPPYGIGYRQGQGYHSNASAFCGKAILGDDRPFDPAPLLARPCLLWGANHFAPRLPGGGRWLVWDKRAGIAADGKAQSDVEIAWASGPRLADRIFRLVWDGFLKGGGEMGTARVHPTQKPIAVMEWSIGFMPARGVICDPYMGSGTTGVAAMKLGRKFVGMELDETYFDAACARIEAAWRAPSMLLEAND